MGSAIIPNSQNFVEPSCVATKGTPLKCDHYIPIYIKKVHLHIPTGGMSTTPKLITKFQFLWIDFVQSSNEKKWKKN